MHTSDTVVPDEFVTAGIKANRHREFTVALNGVTCYKLLQTLEAVAEKSTCYQDIQELVFLASGIRGQLRQQGF